MEILEILGKIGFDWRLALANLVNFVVIYYILKRFVFGPIQDAIHTRQQKISEGMDHSEKAEAELAKIKDEREQVLHQARLDSNRIVNDAQTRAEGLVEKAKADATAEQTAILERGEAKLVASRKEMEANLKAETVGLVVKGMEKILADDLTPEIHDKISARLAK